MTDALVIQVLLTAVGALIGAFWISLERKMSKIFELLENHAERITAIETACSLRHGNT